jgi:holo-[acyl-carrier protein] synthase
MYIGVDILDIARIKVAAERSKGLLNKVYTPVELAYCFKKADPYPSLAVRFAAKEAVRKLDQAFQQGVSWQEIEVNNRENGQPYIVLYGQAAQAMQTLNLTAIRLSLSHASHQAIAAALAY